LLAVPAHEIRIAKDEPGFADADAVHHAVWPGLPPPSQRVRGMLERDPNSVSLHVAYLDGKPVSYGRLEFSPGSPFASLWGGATLPEARGRGCYTALVASRLQEAQQRGCDYLTVDADPNTSMPILHRLGFQTIAISTPFLWHP
jgi:ribosomal protein S18 acetylase RimI-like enzyme